MISDFKKYCFLKMIDNEAVIYQDGSGFQSTFNIIFQ